MTRGLSLSCQGRHEGKNVRGRFEVLCEKWQIEGYPDKVRNEVGKVWRVENK